MKYVALLRGINVGGNRKVPMAELKTSIEELGFTDVVTYINSGNVIFVTDIHHIDKLTKIIEDQIEKDFGFPVATIVRSQDQIQDVIIAIPDSWVNDKEQKCDVMFLWPEIDKPSVLESLQHTPEIEDLKYVPGAILWRIDKDKVTKSKIIKMVGTNFYKQLTIRNCNTVRKIHQLMCI